VVKDYRGAVIGQCLSHNIVITDDHKAQQQQAHGAAEGRRGSAGDLESGRISRRSSLESEESDEQRIPATSGLPTPQGSATNLHSLPSKTVKIPKNLSMTRLNKLEPLLTSKRHAPYPSPSMQKSAGPVEAPTFMRALSLNNIHTFAAAATAAASEQHSYAGRWRGGRQPSITAPASANTSRSNSPPDNIIGTTMLGMPSITPTAATTPGFNRAPTFTSPEMTAFITGITSAPVSTVASPEAISNSPTVQPLFIPSTQNPMWNVDVPGITIPNDIPEIPTANPSGPTITKLIPSEGPMAGGIEVTILGTNLTRPLIPYFGESPATGLDYHGTSTIVAILPPSAVPGPVLVTLRDDFGRPVTNISDFDVRQFFTYKNHTDRDLMELALQIMGYKWFGKVEEPKNIAAMIIGTHNTSSGNNGQGISGSANGGRQEGTGESDTGARGAAGETLEDGLLRVLDLIDRDTSPFPAQLSARSKSGHTMLHYASMGGYTRFLSALLVRGADPSIRDNCGFTPLHYAAWLGRCAVVQRLIAENVGLLALKTPGGKTAEMLAADMGRTKICRILDRAATGEVVLSRASSMASLPSIGSRTSLSEYYGGSERDEEGSEDERSLENEAPEQQYNEEVIEEDEYFLMGSLHPRKTIARKVVEVQLPEPTTSETLSPSPPLVDSSTPPPPPTPLVNGEPFVPVSAVLAFMQSYLSAVRPANRPDAKPPTTAAVERKLLESELEETYDDPPPAYSPHAPPPPTKTVQKFSLATRLSLRGRYILKLTGMAKDAEFTPEELEAVKWNVKISLPNDYMLIYFWV
jgi:hypothetical protein